MEIIVSFFIELIFPLLIEVALVKWKWLTVTGAVAAGILAFVVLILAKWSIWPLVFFLILGTLAGKIQLKKRAKNVDFLDSNEGLEGIVPVEKALESVDAGLGEGGDIKQGKARDHWQVLANGGIFMLLAFLAFMGSSGWLSGILITPAEVVKFEKTCHLLALISLSVSCADTLSSDLGRVWGRSPRCITTGKTVVPGVSGGVTVAGFFGALLGGTLMAVFVFWTDLSGLGSKSYLFLLVLIFGFIGSILDSVLGALFQAKYRNSAGHFVDSSDEGKRPLAAGFGWITNDVVNGITGTLMLLLSVVYLCW